MACELSNHRLLANSVFCMHGRDTEFMRVFAKVGIAPLVSVANTKNVMEIETNDSD